MWFIRFIIVLYSQSKEEKRWLKDWLSDKMQWLSDQWENFKASDNMQWISDKWEKLKDILSGGLSGAKTLQDLVSK